MKNSFLLFFLLNLNGYFGQNQIDFRGMPSFSSDFRLNQRWSITGIGNGIFTNDFHELGFAFLDAGTKYRINRNIGINGNYRLLYKRNFDNSMALRSIYYFDIDFSESFNRLQIGGTIRTQLTDFPASSSLNYLIYNRSKINLKFRQNYFWQPMIEFEFFTPLNHPTRKQTDQIRFLIGCNYTFNENLKLETFLQLRQQINRYPKQTVYLGAVNLIYRF